MNSKMYTFIALLVIIVALAIYFLMPKGPKIISIKTYTAPDGSFSFQYPEFEGWEVNGVSKLRTIAHGDISQRIILNYPSDFNLFAAPEIIITKSSRMSKILAGILKENPSGVQYYGYPEKLNSITFLLKSNDEPFNEVDISLSTGKDFGFPSDQFFKKVIETFKFNEIVTIKGVGRESKAGLVVESGTSNVLILDLNESEVEKYIGKLIEVRGILYENMCNELNKNNPEALSQCFDGPYMTNSQIITKD